MDVSGSFVSRKSSSIIQASDRSSELYISDDVQIRQGIAGRFIPTAFITELKDTLRVSWPMIITQLCNFGLQPVVSIFVGHLGKKELDAVALASSVINVLGLAVVYGMASMCDTYFSQVHGAKNSKLNGIFLQRAILIHLLVLVPLLSLHLNMETILIAIGEDPDISRLAGQYLTIFLPGFVFMFLYVILRKFTYCQDVIYPNLFIGVLSIVLHAIMQYVLIYPLDLGLSGSAIGQVVLYFFMMLATFIYIKFSGMLKDCWTGWSWQALDGWGPMVNLGVFGMLMIVLELFAFEVVTILSGLLGDTELGAQTILFNLDFMFYGIPSGVAVAAGVRVGWHLGANKPLTAKTAASTGMFITGVISLFCCAILFIFRHEAPKMFSNDQDVINLASSLIPFICVYMFFDHISSTCRAFFRVSGKQIVGTAVIFITYYIFCLPIGIPLMFCTSLRLTGLWLSLTVILIVNAVVYSCIIFFRFDWQQLADNAAHRTTDRKPSKIEAADDTPLLGRRNPSTLPSKSVLIQKLVVLLFFTSILFTGVIIRLKVNLYPQLIEETGELIRNSTNIAWNITEGST